MSRIIRNLIFLTLAGILITACTRSSVPGGTSLVADSILRHDSVYYTCTMHPAVISAKPGICAKCGMDLVEVENKKRKE